MMARSRWLPDPLRGRSTMICQVSPTTVAATVVNSNARAVATMAASAGQASATAATTSPPAPMVVDAKRKELVRARHQVLPVTA